MPKSPEKFQPSSEEIKKVEKKIKERDLYTDPPGKGGRKRRGEPILAEEDLDKILGLK